MPALTSYSSYETLVFFQNVVRLGADSPALQQISTTLNENQLIRECDSYDPIKFTPEALLYLYNRVIAVRDNATGNHVNGGDIPNGDHNPKKRKISPVSTPNRSKGQDDRGFLQSVVDNLYASFRKETVEELRREEEQYAKLQQDIADLESRIEDEQKQIINGTSDTAVPSPVPSRPVVQQPPIPLADQPNATSTLSQPVLEVPASKSQSQPRLSPQPVPPAHPPTQHDRAQPSPVPAPRSATPHSGAGTPLPPPPPQLPNQLPPNSSPAAFHRSVPSPSPSRGAQPPLPAPHGYPPPHHQPYPPHMYPPQAGMQRVPSPGEYPPRASSQGRGSPLPYQAQLHYPHPQMYPNGPHQWQPPPNQQYPPYGTPQYYTPQAQNRPPQHMQTPQQQPYMMYPQTAPMPYPPPQWRGPPPVPYQSHPVSASNTPVPRSGSQSALTQSTNSTPWKTKPVPTDIRVRSPSRVERDVSPLSAPGSPIPPSIAENEPTKREEISPPPEVHEQSQDEIPQVSRPAASRSQSVVSAASESRSEAAPRRTRPSKVKPEPPSTPAPLPSDTEQKPSGRRVRPRGNTATTRPDVSRAATASKRKRESVTSRSPSPTPIAPPPTDQQRTNATRVDPSLVMVSRNFAKTCQMLLNEITSHKLAGIFAKPLTERDAPGYKDLILLPQDLKSIKTAVSKGSRAANIAIDELESKEGYDEDAETAHRNAEGAIGNGFYLVPTNEDLLPPKSIVNSSQLETELVRIFANAIMFNPLNDAERGFGRNLRLRKRGGETAAARRARRATTEDTVGTESMSVGEDSATDSTTTPDEGGIIADTREFFKDVTEIVSKWRQLEEERITSSTTGNSLATPNVSGAADGTRHTSVSASSANEYQEEEVANEATPSASTATSRKRRKVGEHF